MRIFRQINAKFVKPTKFDKYSVEIMEILSRKFWQKFRESNDFTKDVTKQLIWQKKISVRVNLLISHTVYRLHRMFSVMGLLTPSPSMLWATQV